MAETKNDANAAFDAFVETYAIKYDKAVGCLSKDREALLAFYDFPAEHWKHLRTTDEIDKHFSARLRAGFAALSVRRRHGSQEGCEDVALSTPTAAEGGGRRPAFTRPHPRSDNRPWRSRGCSTQRRSRWIAQCLLRTQFAACGILGLHGRPRGEEQGWRMKALPRSL